MPAILAKGTKLEVGDGATPTEVFTLIAGIRTITGPANERQMIDVTSHDTPGGFMDEMGGLKRWGALSFELLWDPANVQHQQLWDDYVEDTVRNYKLIFPDTSATTLTFSGFIGPNPITAPYDGALTKTCEVVIKANPAPVWS